MSNRSQFTARDYARGASDNATGRGKRKGELIWADVMADKEQRDGLAWAWRRKGGKVVSVGERVIKFDNVSITTYTITIRNKVAA